MKTENTENKNGGAGEVFYDADCQFCVNSVKRFSAPFIRRGFRWLPMQTPGTAERLNLPDKDLRSEMKLLLPDGRVFGGVDSWIWLLRSVWWLWPLGMFLGIPGIHFIAVKVYRWIARNRHCLGGTCVIHKDGHKRVRPLPSLFSRVNTRTLQSERHRHASFFELP